MFCVRSWESFTDIYKSALDEMHDIFGGDDYDWALEADEEIAEPTEQPETRYQDVRPTILSVMNPSSFLS